MQLTKPQRKALQKLKMAETWTHYRPGENPGAYLNTRTAEALEKRGLAAKDQSSSRYYAKHRITPEGMAALDEPTEPTKRGQKPVYNSNAQKQKAYRDRQHQAREAEQAAKGLPPLPAVATMPGKARWNAMLEKANCLLQQVFEEMESYHDDRRPEWQEGERGQEFSEIMQQVSNLADAATEVSIP